MSAASKPTPITQFENIRLSSPVITNNTLTTYDNPAAQYPTAVSITLPAETSTLATTTTEQTFTNKTLTEPNISGAVFTDGQLNFGDATILLPEESSTLATTTTSQTLSNKHLDGTSTALVKDAAPFTWTPVTPAVNMEDRFARMGGRVVRAYRVGQGANIVQTVEYLDDGTWHTATGFNFSNPEETVFQNIITTDSQFVLTTSDHYYTSPDGKVWTQGTNPSGASFIDRMYYLNGKLYMLGTIESAGSETWYLWQLNTDWSVVTQNSQRIQGVCGADGHLLILLNDKTTVFISTTGVATTPFNIPANTDMELYGDHPIFWLGDCYLSHFDLGKGNGYGLFTYIPGATSWSSTSLYHAEGIRLLVAANHCILITRTGEGIRDVEYSMDNGQTWVPTGLTISDEAVPRAIYTNHRFDVIAQQSPVVGYYVFRSNMCGKISIKFTEMADFFVSSGDANREYIKKIVQYIAYKFQGSGIDLSDILNYVDPDDELDAALPDPPSHDS